MTDVVERLRAQASDWDAQQRHGMAKLNRDAATEIEALRARLSQAGAGGVDAVALALEPKCRAFTGGANQLAMNVARELAEVAVAALAASPIAGEIDIMREAYSKGWRTAEAITPPAPVQTASVEVLPCDVAVAPSTIIRKGCKVSTLMLAINQRKDREVGGVSDTALASLTAPTQGGGERPILAEYTNWRGERSIRTFIPRRVFWGSNEWHPEPQVLIEAYDCEKEALRTFAASGFATPSSPVSSPSPAGGVREALDALLPFASTADHFDDYEVTADNPSVLCTVRLADLRRARTVVRDAAVSSSPEPSGSPNKCGFPFCSCAKKGVCAHADAALSSPATGEVVDWQPISTAKRKHGERLILALENGEVVMGWWGVGRYDRSRKDYNCTWVDHPGNEIEPTHWAAKPMHPAALNPAPGHGEGGL